MKLGITLNDKYLSLVEKWAKNNGLKKTTICSIILSQQLDYLISRNIEPTFEKKYVMTMKKVVEHKDDPQQNQSQEEMEADFDKIMKEIQNYVPDER